MKKNKLLLLIGLFPLLMSNSAAPIPYVAINSHYVGFRINEITQVIEEENENEEENNEEEEEISASSSYIYTFDIENYGSYVLEHQITLIINRHYEVILDEYNFVNEENDNYFYILPNESKELTFDLKEYSHIFEDDKPLTISQISAKEGVAYRYEEKEYSSYSIINRVVASDSSSTTFDVAFDVESLPSTMFAGLHIRYLEDGKNTSIDLSCSNTRYEDQKYYASFTIEGVKNKADIKSVDLILYLNANIYSPTKLNEEGKMFFIYLIIILSILIISGVISLTIGLMNSKKKKELLKEKKEEERERLLKEKEDKKRLKEEKRKAKENINKEENETPIKEEENTLVKENIVQESVSISTLIDEEEKEDNSSSNNKE